MQSYKIFSNFAPEKLNNTMKKLSSLVIVASVTMLSACGPSDPMLGRSSVEDVISGMTLEEKAHLVIGTGMEGFESGDSAVVGDTRKLVPGAAGTSYPIPRLGIPAIVLADGPAGLRIKPTREGDEQTYYCTHFPIGTLLSSAWDTSLVEEVGKAIGEEVLEYGADVLLAPALNIHRNPLCGRNFEYYSEDPLVAGRTAAAYVRGVQANGVGTSVKHFACNNQETNRMANNVEVSARALREIYLKGFEIAIKEAEPWTVMSSYNKINGTYTSENKELLTTLLRDEWGYDGMVMTDWFGGKDAVAQMEAGNDMLQPGRDKQYEEIVSAVREGRLDEKVLDRNVERILQLILKTPRFNDYHYTNHPDLEAHAALTRRSATEGMVLLKNNGGTLPMGTDVKRVAVFGKTSYEFIAGGTGSGDVNRAYTISLWDGLKNAGYTTDEGDVENLSTEADMAIVTLGRVSGEFFDRETQDFYLSQDERRMVTDVCRAFHAVGKKVVVVLNIGGVVETASWRDMPDAILCAWQAGQEGGNSVVDVLSGQVSPSGKLPMTFPIRREDHASSANFPLDVKLDVVNDSTREKNMKDVDYTRYEEGIYVGYRYFDTYGKPVAYPFGYGLSYTTFEYANPSIVFNEEEGCYDISVDVKNTGDMAGKEIVQLYVSAPNYKEKNKPKKELKAFAKTRELALGASERVNLRVKPIDLASFDEEQSAWVTDAGVYEFLISASSEDVKAVLKAEVPSVEVKTNDIFR